MTGGTKHNLEKQENIILIFLSSSQTQKQSCVFDRKVALDLEVIHLLIVWKPSPTAPKTFWSPLFWL